ncbi:hypothetical protein DMC47_17410 [Nostoc sp. 3335mG]|nr:hypothetical protein DMC47_17410 [Nostoc sp. 3335mG]
MRLIVFAASAISALFAAHVAAPLPAAAAQKLSAAALDCVRDTAPATLRTSIADGARAGTDDAWEAAEAKLQPTVDACASRFSVPADQRGAYTTFGGISIVMPELAARIRRAGLDPAIADRAIGAGPGKPAPDTREQAMGLMVEKVIKAYQQSSNQSLGTETAALLGLYTANAVSYWYLRSQLAGNAAS